jgi:hypothetical protein
VSSSLNWVVVWNDREDGREYRDHSRSRALALNAACDLIRQQHTVQRIEGRNGVVIGRQAIERYCAKAARDRRDGPQAATGVSLYDPLPAGAAE